MKVAISMIMCGLLMTPPVLAFPPKEWRFKVLLDNRPIGQHSFVLGLERGQQVLKSEADFGVRFLGFNAYRYRHVAIERWEGGCLREIDAHTNDNGNALSVKGRTDAERFLIEGPRGTQALSRCIMSFAYWNPDILKQTRLLNAQNGEYQSVRVKNLGATTVNIDSASVMSRHYRLEADKFKIDLWYDINDQWLALETRTEGGRMLRYELVDPRPISNRSGRNA